MILLPCHLQIFLVIMSYYAQKGTCYPLPIHYHRALDALVGLRELRSVFDNMIKIHLC